jgi:hypothetical protein
LPIWKQRDHTTKDNPLFNTMTEIEEISSPDDVADELEKLTVEEEEEEEGEEETPATDDETANVKSALRENIERKGKNSYYFAHAHKADGPLWDGKAEPKLLSSSIVSNENRKMTKIASFDIQKSNITSYAFSDEAKAVKLFITMEGVGEKCIDEDIDLDFSESSFCLVVRNYKEEEQCLRFGKLAANITKATYRLKKDRIVLTLIKEKEGEWHTINDKGTPDHGLV